MTRLREITAGLAALVAIFVITPIALVWALAMDDDCEDAEPDDEGAC